MARRMPLGPNPVALQLDQFKTDINTAAVATLLRVQARVVDLSPVDAGEFRRAWEVQIEGLVKSVLNSSAYAAMIEYGGWKKFNMPGPKTTKEGFSRQAPAGVISVVRDEIPGIFQEELAKARKRG